MPSLSLIGAADEDIPKGAAVHVWGHPGTGAIHVWPTAVQHSQLGEPMGPFETEARAFLGERGEGMPESQYLFSLAELVRTREKFAKAAERVTAKDEQP